MWIRGVKAGSALLWARAKPCGKRVDFGEQMWKKPGFGIRRPFLFPSRSCAMKERSGRPSFQRRLTHGFGKDPSTHQQWMDCAILLHPKSTSCGKTCLWRKKLRNCQLLGHGAPLTIHVLFDSVGGKRTALAAHAGFPARTFKGSSRIPCLSGIGRAPWR